MAFCCRGEVRHGAVGSGGAGTGLASHTGGRSSSGPSSTTIFHCRGVDWFGPARRGQVTSGVPLTGGAEKFGLFAAALKGAQR